MRATTSAALLLVLAAVALAREGRSPDGAWTLTLPETWEAAKPEAYEKMPQNVHAIFMSAPDEDQKRALLQVSVIEKELQVSKQGKEEFRALCDADIKASQMAEAGVQSGIERVEVERISDRDAYRTDGFQIGKNAPPLKVVKWYVPAGDKQFVFSFTASAKSFPFRVVEFEEIARTIRMREAPPAKPGAGTDWNTIVTIAGISVAIVCAVAFVIVLRGQLARSAEAGK